ncbi:GSU2403 family nucleotidyltransferase fold protein [soil metagenome]
MFATAPLSDAQLRQYINAESVFSALEAARHSAAQVRGGMLWRTVDGRRYLIRTSASGGQKSLGPEAPETAAMYERFTEKKQAAEQRLRALRAALDEQRRLNRALRVGRVPKIVVDTLNAIAAHALARNFVTVGTHALYAYEAAAGLRLDEGTLATRDIDLFFDATSHMQFLGALRTQKTTLLGILRKADKSFQVRQDQKQTAVNDQGFEIDFIRREHKGRDPHPLALSEHPDEDSLWAVQVSSGDQMDSGGRFRQMVVSTTGEMASLETLSPTAFVRIKKALAASPTRDRLKAPKDARQAQVVQWMLDERMLIPQDAASA